MLNFTVGPVMSSPEVLEVSAESAPYFRTKEFSDLMFENEKIFLSLLNAPEGSRAVFLTASGTGAMESCVMNVLNDNDKVIVINGGSFGQRFVDLCALHGRSYAEIKLEFGTQVTRDHLAPFEGSDYTALLVNMHETSSGLLYDMELLSEFCKRNGILLVVDAISAFLAEEIDMGSLGAAVVITGSQKALAVHPGVSLVAMAPAAIERVESNGEKCLYLSLKQGLSNGTRGQTPWTPAVSVLMQINTRLRQIVRDGGVAACHKRTCELASQFRTAVSDYSFELVAENPSVAVTALKVPSGNAKQIFEAFKLRGIWVCPNGGAHADDVFRVGHIGHITDADMASLLAAFEDLHREGLL